MKIRTGEGADTPSTASQKPRQVNRLRVVAVGRRGRAAPACRRPRPLRGRRALSALPPWAPQQPHQAALRKQRSLLRRCRRGRGEGGRATARRLSRAMAVANSPRARPSARSSPAVKTSRMGEESASAWRRLSSRSPRRAASRTFSSTRTSAARARQRVSHRSSANASATTLTASMNANVGPATCQYSCSFSTRTTPCAVARPLADGEAPDNWRRGQLPRAALICEGSTMPASWPQVLRS